jgi:alpha-aminoadipate/glutamate carrier protein LysW
LQNPAGAVRLSTVQTQQGGVSPKEDLLRARLCHQPFKSAGGKDEVPTGTCPECDADVHVDTDADKGDMVSCEECGTDLEIVGLDPVELDIVEEDDFDEDEEEDEY